MKKNVTKKAMMVLAANRKYSFAITSETRLF